ncbi:hypothetical protein NKH10_17680 [Mesorhizobium sp. M1340]|uniref:hypothetical protein n=1 Tax=unclassified Mesorhizobium TaxID=325217 RepID=UPI00333D4CDD
MTAEIAILNKMAVALATDSAVTISAGSEEQKIYDSADKLFDLCGPTPIGVMIYHGMQFMQAPLPMLIADYRQRYQEFDRLPEAAYDLLRFLCEWGAKSPQKVSDASLTNMIEPVMDRIKARVQEKLEKLVSGKPPEQDDFMKHLRAFFEESVALFERILAKRPDAKFLGPDGKKGPPKIGDAEMAAITAVVARNFHGESEAMTARLADLGKNAVLKNMLSGGETGVVVAGFGKKDIFPSLASFEIDGMAFGRLKYIETNTVDIDRDGDRARVIPFAQKEMVERFLYGLDEGIERYIMQFCINTVPDISSHILANLEMGDEDRAALGAKAEEAQRAFLSELQNSTFADIRSQSKSAIEDMVEFMPKPELATMAEALVNLTSIKRKVSRGMETVGGPIDVAIISRADGFIWVKRKHYFTAELNPRYVNRVQHQPARRENSHESQPDPRPRRPAKARPSR